MTIAYAEGGDTVADRMQTSQIRASVSAPAPRSAYWLDLLLGRAVPALFFAVFVVYKLLLIYDSYLTLTVPGAQPDATDYLWALNQLLGLGFFSLLAFLYVTRLPRRSGIRRVETTVVSFFGTFAILSLGFLPGVPPRAGTAFISDLVIALGLGYTLWGLTYLRRSFSILPEARRLVTGGPYRLSRHPLYFGEALAATGLIIPTAGWQAIVLMVFILVAQFMRISWEEAVLLKQFPAEYAAYRRCVPKYLPRPWRLLNR
jgi:protein-S-isoprenylcysteine O-methyltransferase Ste14